MKAKPILFSTPMVQALLDGRKTQTRRIIKASMFDLQLWIANKSSNNPKIKNTCPFGKIGDLLWVRETWRPDCAIMKKPGSRKITCPAIRFKVGEGRLHLGGKDKPQLDRIDGKWKPSIHMPRWASRLTLEVTDIRVERIQNISKKDAIAEGVLHCVNMFHAEPNWDEDDDESMFQELWESINGKDSWKANPWVWVIEFKTHKCNVDEFKKVHI